MWQITGFLKDYEAVRKLLKENIPDYEKKDDVFPMLEGYLDKATKRASQLEEYHLKNGNAVPYGIAVNGIFPAAKVTVPGNESESLPLKTSMV